MHLYLILSWFLLIPCFITAQSTRAAWDPDRNKGRVLLFGIGAGAHMPAADLAKRFKGPEGSAGLFMDFIAANNMIAGIEGAFFFGDKVLEDPLTILRLENGEIIGNDLSYASFNLQERGFYYGCKVGKLFPEKAKDRAFGPRWEQAT